MDYWICYYGLAYAGFSCENQATIVKGTQEEAERAAQEEAIEFMESYEGSHGIPTFSDDEGEIDGDEVLPWNEIYDYIDYRVELVNKESLENLDLYEELNSAIKYHKDDKNEIYAKYNL